MLFFSPQRTIKRYSKITKSKAGLATLYVHVDFTLSSRASYWKYDAREEYEFAVKSLFEFSVVISEQITKFTFHLHDDNAFSGIQKSLQAGLYRRFVIV